MQGAGEPRSAGAPGAGAALRPGEGMVLLALAAILGTTAAWWAAALWPLPAATPEWVVRARAACFGVGRSGLPHAGGWIMLVGTPASLLAMLVVIWGGTLRSALRRTLATGAGRLASAAVAGAFVAIMAASGAKAAGAAGFVRAADEPLRGDVVLQPLDEEPGELGLRDHRGERIDASRFSGAPLLVTFAFGRCETICPLIVQEATAARAALAGDAPPLVIITVDPWRDAPRRLPHIAAAWALDDEAHLLGGSVPEVERALDSWRVVRSRDERTGEVAHPSLVYVLDGRGRIRFAVPGWREHIVAAVTQVRDGAE
jgi:cytochrome oxidase Cu insertion factor (SCO1/SenC/PrrC family)